MWRLPCSWTSFEPEADRVRQAYVQADRQLPVLRSATEPLGDKLLAWSRTCEASVDVALASRPQTSAFDVPRMRLPGACRGRCVPRSRVQGVVPQMPRRGRAGDPQPHAHTSSVRSRQRLRQCRRLSTLERGLRKLAILTTAAAQAASVHLRREWQAIRLAPGYEGGFCSWLLQWPCFGHVPLDLPDYIHDVLQLVIFDYRALASREAKLKADCFRYRMHVDQAEAGCSLSFAQVRPAAYPRILCGVPSPRP